jgi:hypothetical protein
MRLSGFALLFVGFVLCITVAWAALGFLAMSGGLICLLIADERNKKQRLARVANKPIGTDRAGVSRPRADADIRRIERANDVAKWASIVKADPDIRSVAEILAQYGPSYVDQLARVYLVFDDKTLLPMILELIVTSAKQHLPTSRINPHPSGRPTEPESRTSRVATDQARPSTPAAAFQPDREMETWPLPSAPASVSMDGSHAQPDSGKQTAAPNPPLTPSDLSTLLAVLANAK